MTDRPIPFSAPMARALLDGRKTQTRRFLGSLRSFGPVTEFGPSDTAGYQWHFRDKGMRWHDLRHAELLKALRWQTGDRLYVREHWRTESNAYDDLAPSEMDADYPVIFEADADWSSNKAVGRFRQGMHMPRWASRLTLTVTDVRVQRLTECTEEDALAEGVVKARDGYFTVPGVDHPNKAFGELSRVTAREMYAALWDVINGSGSWLSSPWVVVLTFTVERRNIDALPMPYLIWSNVHRAWWRDNRAGYCTELAGAGRYTREEAIKQCAYGRDGFTTGRLPPELPVREIDAINQAGRCIDDLVLKADRAECRARDLANKAKLPA